MTLKLFPVLVWKQKKTKTLDVTWTKILILIMTGLITAGPKQCNSIAIYPIDELVSLHE